MKLQNDYKVIYSAKRANDILRLFGTKNQPAAADEALIYVNNENYTLTDDDVKAIKLVYSKNDKIYYSTTGMPADTDKYLAIFNGDELVFGDDEISPVAKYAVSFTAVENVVFGGAGNYAEGATVNVTVTPAEGYQFGEGNAPTCAKCTLTEESGVFKGSFEMGEEAVEVSVTGIVVEEKPVAKAGYYKVLAVADRGESVELDNTWTAIDEVSESPLALNVSKESGFYYVCFALKDKNATEMYADDDRTVKNQNLLKAGEEFFEKATQEFNDGSYSVYVAKNGDYYQLNETHDFDIYF